MLVFSDVQSLCISARLWLQVGSPKRLRSDLNQTVSFPPTLFSSSMLRVYFKSILAHTCTASPLTSVVWPPCLSTDTLTTVQSLHDSSLFFSDSLLLMLYIL